MNEGTIFSYNITRPGYSGQSISTMVINDDTVPPDEDGNRIKKFDIRLSKNGYIYYEIKPPYKESGSSKEPTPVTVFEPTSILTPRYITLTYSSSSKEFLI